MQTTVIRTTLWQELRENVKMLLTILGIVTVVFTAGAAWQSIQTRFEVMAADNSRTYQTIDQASTGLLEIKTLLAAVHSQINEINTAVNSLDRRIATIEGYLKPR